MKKILFMFFVLCTMFIVSCNEKEDCKLTIVYGTGYEDVVIDYKYNSVVEMPELLINENSNLSVYMFTDEDIEEVTFPFNIKNDIKIYAEWQEAVYTYKFMAADGVTVLFEGKGKKGEDIVFPTTNPTKEKEEHATFEFSYWYPNIKKVNGSTTFEPRFNRIVEEEKITFYVENNIYATDTTLYESKVFEPEIPTIDVEKGKYAMFLGWKEEGATDYYNFEAPVLNDLKLYACFDIDNIYQKPLSECTISVLGDSVSTFYSSVSKINSIYQGTNEYYYPIYSQDVKTVEKTWWYQVINGLGAKFGIIESKSGSTLVNSGDTETRLARLKAKGIPNIVLVQMTGNDNVSNIDTKNVAASLEKVYKYITNHYVEKTDKGYVIPQVYFVTASYSATTYGEYTEQHRLEYNEEMRKIAALYDNCHVYDLAELITKDNYTLYLGDSLHYNAAGMKVHADGFIKKIKEDWE